MTFPDFTSHRLINIRQQLQHYYDIMEKEYNKRIKIAKESSSTVKDIADSINDIAKSIESLSEVHRDMLRINRAVVSYLHKAEALEEESLNEMEV